MPVPSTPSTEAAQGSESPFHWLLKHLTKWQQIITILIFFGGSVLWVLGYFATKQQLKQFDCLSRANIALTRSEAAGRYVADDILRKSERIDRLTRQAKITKLSDADATELRRLQREIKDLEEKGRSASKDYQDAEKMLTGGKCTEEK